MVIDFFFDSRVFPLLSEVAQRKGKLNKAASDDSAASEILLDALLGNSNTCLLASVGGNGKFS